jgi:DNA-binding transcriptional MerR regulator
MLREYDRRGLVTPARVDPAAGYRWYHTDQLPRSRRLRALHERGASLDALDERSSTGPLLALLRERRDALRERIAADHRHVRRIEARMYGLAPIAAVPMDAVQPLLATLLGQHDGLHLPNLALRFAPRTGDLVHEAHGADATRWMIVLGRADAAGEHMVNTWLNGATGWWPSDSLLEQGWLLQELEVRGYPAPRLVPCLAGGALAMDHGWCVLVTREHGTPLAAPTDAQWQSLGAQRARPHRLERAGSGWPATGWPQRGHSPQRAGRRHPRAGTRCSTASTRRCRRSSMPHCHGRSPTAMRTQQRRS